MVLRCNQLSITLINSCVFEINWAQCLIFLSIRFFLGFYSVGANLQDCQLESASPCSSSVSAQCLKWKWWVLARAWCMVPLYATYNQCCIRIMYISIRLCIALCPRFKLSIADGLSSFVIHSQNLLLCFKFELSAGMLTNRTHMNSCCLSWSLINRAVFYLKWLI